MGRYFPVRRLPTWQCTLIALGATGCAWLVRMSLGGLLQGEAAYMPFLLAVMAAAPFGGLAINLVAAVLGGVLANLTFVGSPHSLELEGALGWGFWFYIMVACLLVTLIYALSTSLRREASISEQLATVSEEYRHRIKNLLTVVQALTQQTGRNSASVQDFQQNLVGRLHALSRTQELLLDEGGAAIPIQTLLSETLAPYEIEARLERPLAGPEVFVASEMAVAVSLLLNELATNSTKYGALSVPEGRLQLGWNPQDRWTVVEWKEVGGPPVTAPLKLGFGSRLFANALPRADGKADLTFESDGVRCVIRIRTSSQPPRS